MPVPPPLEDDAPSTDCYSLYLPKLETSMLAAMAAKSAMDVSDVILMAIRKAYFEWHRREFNTPSVEEIARLQAVDAHVKAVQAEESKREAERRRTPYLSEEEYNARKAAAEAELRAKGPPPF